MATRSSPPAAPTPVRFTDLGLTACALSCGATLQRVADEGARVAFYLIGAPDQFFEDVEAGTLQVRARDVVQWLQHLATLVRGAQAARRRGDRR